MVLGYFDNDYKWVNGGEGSRQKRGRYHSQFYANGSKCDLTGDLRSVEIKVSNFLFIISSFQSSRRIYSRT